MNFAFIEFLIISLLALSITFVLFKYLKATAEGQGKLLGGTIKYGGSLAGFALIMFLLTQAYNMIVTTDEATEVNHQKQETSEINLAGAWQIKLSSNDSVEQGKVNIFQEAGSPHVRIVGQVSNRTFRSEIGMVDEDRRLLFVYENNEGEKGIAFGAILDNQPDSFLIRYYDAYSFSTTGDTIGEINFFRQVSK